MSIAIKPKFAFIVSDIITNKLFRNSKITKLREKPLMICTEPMSSEELLRSKQPKTLVVARANLVIDATIALIAEIVVVIVLVVLRMVIAASIAVELVIGRVSVQSLVRVEMVIVVDAGVEVAEIAQDVVEENMIAIAVKVVASDAV